MSHEDNGPWMTKMPIMDMTCMSWTCGSVPHWDNWRQVAFPAVRSFSRVAIAHEYTCLGCWRSLAAIQCRSAQSILESCCKTNRYWSTKKWSFDVWGDPKHRHPKRKSPDIHHWKISTEKTVVAWYPPLQISKDRRNLAHQISIPSEGSWSVFSVMCLLAYRLYTGFSCLDWFCERKTPGC